MIIKIENGTKLEIKIGELFCINAMLVYPKSMTLSSIAECWGLVKYKHAIFLGSGEYDTVVAGRGYVRKLYFYVYIDFKKMWHKFYTYEWHISSLEHIATIYET